MDIGKRNLIMGLFNYVQTGILGDQIVEGKFKLNKGIPKVYEKIKRRRISNLDNKFGK